MKWTIAIDRLRIHAFHGLLPQETRVGNMFEVSVELQLEAESSVYPIDIADSVNYAELAALVKEVMATPEGLLENVALKLRTALLTRWPQATGGRVAVAKLTPPIPAQMASASVSLSW